MHIRQTLLAQAVASALVLTTMIAPVPREQTETHLPCTPTTCVGKACTFNGTEYPPGTTLIVKNGDKKDAMWCDTYSGEWHYLRTAPDANPMGLLPPTFAP